MLVYPTLCIAVVIVGVTPSRTLRGIKYPPRLFNFFHIGYVVIIDSPPDFVRIVYAISERFRKPKL